MKCKRSQYVFSILFLAIAIVAVAPWSAQANPPPVRIHVNSTLDTVDAAPGNGICDDGGGNCTLRAAIQEANAGVNFGVENIIEFSIPSAGNACVSGVCTITIATPLPALTDSQPTIIDGTTQLPACGSFCIVVTGNPVGATFTIKSDNNVIRGLVINGNTSDPAILITATGAPGGTANKNSILQNKIDANGVGVRIAASGAGTTNTNDNCIGGLTGVNDLTSETFRSCDPIAAVVYPSLLDGGSGNLITNHSTAGIQVTLGSDGNVIIGNVIGGGNGIGISDDSDSFTTIGGVPGGLPAGPLPKGNIINANTGDGIQLNNNVSGTCGGPAGCGTNIAGNIIGSVGSGNGGHGIHVLATNNAQQCIGGIFSGTCGGGGVSGNSITANILAGVKIDATTIANDIIGNTINFNVLDGVRIDPSSNQCIGGTIVAGVCTPSAGTGNVINSNLANGVSIDGNNNTVIGNCIGSGPTVAACNLPGLGNALDGVLIFSSGGSSHDNVIGGTTDAARNIISGQNSGFAGVHISGTVGPGAANNNSVLGDYIGTDGAGTGANGNTVGVVIEAPLNSSKANNNCIGGLIVGGVCIPQLGALNNFPTNLAGNLINANGTGVFLIGGADGNNIISNFFGLDKTGNAGGGPLGNAVGIADASDSFTCIGASNSLPGGCVPVSGTINGRNIISGSSLFGIKIFELIPGDTVNDTIIANYIGTDRTGTIPVPNQVGVFLDPSSFNQVGGDAFANPLVRNVISGNSAVGVLITGVEGPPLTITSTHNSVQGNLIGTKSDAVSPLPNGAGVVLALGAQDNNVGDGSLADAKCNPGLGNVIAFNLAHGVNVDGITSFHNRIRCNSIHDNGGVGISLTHHANNDIPPPTVTATSTIDGTAKGGSIVDGYNDNGAQGGTYIGEDLANTNCNGGGICQYTITGSNPNKNATATQTDALGDTSAFSKELATNHAPTALAGNDATVHAGIPVTQTGNCTDPDAGQTCTFAWSLVGANTAACSFASPTNQQQVTVNTNLGPGACTVQLVVTDNGNPNLPSAPDSFQITTTNNPPFFASPVDQTVVAGQSVTLDSGAKDPDVDSLTYLWSLPGGAGTAGCSLPGPNNNSTVKVNTSAVGTCQVRIDVSDGHGGTANTTVTITTVVAIVCNVSAATVPVSDPIRFRRNQTRQIDLTVTNAASSTGAATITGIAAIAGLNLSVTQVLFGKKKLLPAFSITLPIGSQQTFRVRIKSSVKQTLSPPFVQVAGLCGAVAFNTPANDRLLHFVPALRLTLEQLAVRVQAGQIVAEAQGAGIRSLQLQVFDANGRLVVDQTVEAAQLSLSAVDRNGKALANGVYMAVITVQGNDGKILRSGVKKLLVLR
ncbi:CSLREA domain-containing protein [Candidatus Acetothermia bacterium]|nr:CSLREA domain-containing protein [Candidatus Acetothermia bacterium]